MHGIRVRAARRWGIAPAAWAAVVSIAMGNSCSTHKVQDPSAQPGPVTTVDVLPEGDTLWFIGDTLRLSVTARDAAARVVTGHAVVWSSDDNEVVSVSAAGTASARATGAARVTATVGGVSGTVTLWVQRWAAVAVGSRACAITSTGAAYCWGSGVAVPAAVPGDRRFTAVSVGRDYACGITADQAAFCWGNNTWGQLGDGSFLATAIPVAVAGALKFSSVATVIQVGIAGAHTCGLTTDALAYCWGSGEDGQLGAGSGILGALQDCGTETSRRRCMKVPVPVAGGLRFKSLSAGSLHGCGVSEAGGGYCWGIGPGGAPFGAQGNYAPVTIPRAVTLASVAGKFQHSCGITPSAEAYCWGADIMGKLGYGPGEKPDLVTRVIGDGFASISPGSQHTCALKLDQSAYCWGDNRGGAVGDGTGVSRDTPTAVAGGLRFEMVAAGFGSCGLATTGAVYCWGWGADGGTGNGTLTPSNVPTRIANP